MLFNSVSPDSTQTDADKQDILEFKKNKIEPCDKLGEFIIQQQIKEVDFCKPSVDSFCVYRDRRLDAHSAHNSPCKPRLSVDTSRATRLGTCKSTKRARGRDSPISSYDEVYIY